MHSDQNAQFDSLLNKLNTRQARVGVVGLGYVGLPLLAAISRAGFPTIGFDVDIGKIEQLLNGSSYIPAVSAEEMGRMLATGHFTATSDFREIASADVVVICVPTPLNKNREPDLSYVRGTVANIASHGRSGQLVVLESTTYPGTTTEVVRPELESRGLNSEVDLFIAFSPEREDPGNPTFSTDTIPKVVGGDGPKALQLADAFYSAVVARTVRVSSTEAAEAVKITENIFRAVNIALVNELKIVFGAMGVDIWEVIDAAATKPFGFMPFYPGPGLGGHCIPIDPFYLTWKAREFGVSSRFVELAGEVNVAMPEHVVNRLASELDLRFAQGLNGARVLVVGMAYKKNVSDIRESPALRLLELLIARKANVAYHDPLVPVIGPTREHPELRGLSSAPLTEATLNEYDVVLIATDHDNVDYRLVGEHSRLVVDTRNALARRGIRAGNITTA